MYKCTLIKDGIDCTVEMRETRKCQNKLPQMVYCSNFMVFCHIETLHNYQIISLKKNPLTEVPFNRTRFIEEVDSICSPQHGSSCGLNCDSPSPKKCTQVLTPDACESDPNLFGIRIFADILRTSLVAQGVESPCNAGHPGSIPGLGRFPWRREWLPTPVFLPGEFHGQRSLGGYSPRGCKESDTTEVTER